MATQMICPCCGGVMKEVEGLRGISPNLWKEMGWRCNTGYDCDLVGHILYASDLINTAKLLLLMEITRNNKFVQMIRSYRKATGRG